MKKMIEAAKREAGKKSAKKPAQKSAKKKHTTNTQKRVGSNKETIHETWRDFVREYPSAKTFFGKGGVCWVKNPAMVTITVEGFADLKG